MNMLEQINEVKDMIIMEYIYDLIYGETSRIDSIKNITSIVNLNKIPNIVLTLMVDEFWDICINMDNKQRYYIKRLILNLVRKSISDYGAIACSLIGT